MTNDLINRYLYAVTKRLPGNTKEESIFEIAMLILFLVIFLAVPQIFGMILSSPTRIIPIFNVDVMKSTWYIFSLYMLMGLVREIVKLLEGRYNKKVMVTSFATNIISAILAFWWLTNDNIMNAEFISIIFELFEKDNSFIANIFGNFQYFFLSIILFALLLDTVDTFIKSKQ